MRSENLALATYETHVKSEEGTNALVGFFNARDRATFFVEYGALWGALFGLLFGAAFLFVPGA